ncbi:homoserine dehydrogenase [Heyndrickxia sp. NPDC080065]|uniref:homoserine dehydrogenase n=1 Tax=Heyndrickxia sp. NPDC080065 TaxID=3390568 RepID=UPI003D06CB58
MTVIKAALLGFGTVGEGVYTAIQTHQTHLRCILGAEVEIAAILIRDSEKERKIDADILVTTNFEDILNIPDLHVIFEAIVGEEPGYTYLQQAIDRGLHVITANKVMFAKYGEYLIHRSRQKGVKIGFEATTAGGVPIIRTIQQLLQVNQITKIQGILNGTSNFILTEMRKRKLSFDEALELAQQKGYAEADPTNDINGKDAFCKLMILSQLIFGEQPNWSEVGIDGITSITQEQIEHTESLGQRYKHIAQISKIGNSIHATVKPIVVNSDHSLYSIEGVENAISIEASLVGKITLQGPGAGKLPTASAMIEDFVDIFQKEPIHERKLEYQVQGL